MEIDINVLELLPEPEPQISLYPCSNFDTCYERFTCSQFPSFKV